MKSADHIGHSKFMAWRQLDHCSVTRPFLSVKGVACETRLFPGANHMCTGLTKWCGPCKKLEKQWTILLNYWTDHVNNNIADLTSLESSLLAHVAQD